MTHTSLKLWIAAGAVNGFLAVGMGAMAAHSLQSRLSPDALSWIDTGSRYGMAHALALLAVACLGRQEPSPQIGLRVAGWGFLVGSILFSGSLYVMALSESSALSMLVPIGGLCLLVGWAGLLLYCTARRKGGL